jgi:hypothetical protein
MGSDAKSSRSSATSGRDDAGQAVRFVVCVRNHDYPVSLEVRKIYQVIPDADGEQDGFLRVVDETGEDYLFPADMFVPIALPDAAHEAFKAAS